MRCQDDTVLFVFSVQESENTVPPLLQPKLHFCVNCSLLRPCDHDQGFLNVMPQPSRTRSWA